MLYQNCLNCIQYCEESNKEMNNIRFERVKGRPCSDDKCYYFNVCMYLFQEVGRSELFSPTTTSYSYAKDECP